MDSWTRNLRAASSNSSATLNRSTKKKDIQQQHSRSKELTNDEPLQKQKRTLKSSSTNEISRSNLQALSSESLQDSKYSIRKSVSNEVLSSKQRKQSTNLQKNKTTSSSGSRKLLNPKLKKNHRSPSVPDIKKSPSLETIRIKSKTNLNRKKSLSEMKFSQRVEMEIKNDHEESKAHQMIKSLAGKLFIFE